MMQLPLGLQEAVEIAYQQMEQEPHHALLPKQRRPIYQVLETLDPAIVPSFQSQLALLTARFVLPIWRQAEPENDLAPRIVALAEGLLSGKLTWQETRAERESFYHAIGNAEEYLENSKALAAFDTAYCALMVVGGYRPFSETSPKQIEEGFPDELLKGWRADAASSGVLAWSGVGYQMGLLLEAGVNLYYQAAPNLAILTSTTHPAFEPEKRKQFWEWWLNEAIPQAWEQAHQPQLGNRTR